MRIYFRTLLVCKWLILLNGGSAWESNPHFKARKPLCHLGFVVINLGVMHDSARQVLNLL